MVNRLPFCIDGLPPLFQGRAGSDGARGMPGQTGPKVGVPTMPMSSTEGVIVPVVMLIVR
jgi:hypothetical protein